jgi:twitching motility two-component system response regulator PilH
MAKKILIIDDEKDMRTYLSALFKKAGYETETAENGEAGLKAAQASPPDLISLDILMPKQSGVRTYRELRSGASTKGVPIIILTGLTQQEDFFSELGSLPQPDAIVEKPIDRDDFLDKVKKVIGD